MGSRKLPKATGRLGLRPVETGRLLRRGGRVVRQWPAKPRTPVRFRSPPRIVGGSIAALRAVSSGGERFLDTEEVRGSNPLPPTREVAGRRAVSHIERFRERPRNPKKAAKVPHRDREVGNRAANETSPGIRAERSSLFLGLQRAIETTSAPPFRGGRSRRAEGGTERGLSLVAHRVEHARHQQNGGSVASRTERSSCCSLLATPYQGACRGRSPQRRG